MRSCLKNENQEMVVVCLIVNQLTIGLNIETATSRISLISAEKDFL